MAVKTITLDGTEGCITGLCGCYASVLNQGAATVYASPMPDITAGADGVTPVPAGGSALVECGDTLYLLGTGEVTAVGHSQPVPFFKPALSSGEGGADAVARTAIENHEKNTDIHLTAAEIGSAISDDNIVVNSDFSVNQRGQTEYVTTADGPRIYCVDKWQQQGAVKVTVIADDGIIVTPTDTIAANTTVVLQDCPIDESLDSNKYIALSLMCAATAAAYFRIFYFGADSNSLGSSPVITPDSTDYKSYATVGTMPTGTRSVRVCINFRSGAGASDYIHMRWIKAQRSKVDTPYNKPTKAENLVECQYFYQVRSTGDINPVDLRPSMGNVIDVKERSDGNYEYIAE